MYFYCKCGEVVKRKIAYPKVTCVECKKKRWSKRSHEAWFGGRKEVIHRRRLEEEKSVV